MAALAAESVLREFAAPEKSDSFTVFGALAPDSVVGITDEIRSNVAGGSHAIRERLAQCVVELIGNAIDHGADSSGHVAHKARHDSWRVPVSLAIGHDEVGYYVKSANITDAGRAAKMVTRINQLAKMNPSELEERFDIRYDGTGSLDKGLLGLLMTARMSASDTFGHRRMSARIKQTGGKFAALEIKTYVRSDS